MFTCRRMSLALAAMCLWFLVSASAAVAAGPAAVTVRVLGPAPMYEALTPITQVSTTTSPVIKEGHSCSGTNAIGALDLATKGNWGGKFEGNEWFITAIDGAIFDGPETYWGFWVNNRYATKGVCGLELESGYQLLFLPEDLPAGCFKQPKENCTPPKVLSIETPTTAEVGRPVTVTVLAYPNLGGEPSSAPPLPAAGITVEGGGGSAETGIEGHAGMIFTADGTYALRATGALGEDPRSVPGEALVCVHHANDGACGTPAPGSTSGQGFPSGGASSFSSAPYDGPYSIVAKATNLIEGHVYSRKHAPRLLAGTVQAHRTVASVSLKLRREYKGRCYAYDGKREEFKRARCGTGSYFKVSTEPRFSYLLPSALAPGRYVLDIEATDAAGNRTSLARGTSRTVFYVG